MIWVDPIVLEVRKTREKIWEECNYDFDELFRMLKEKRKSPEKRMITKAEIIKKEAQVKSED